MKRRLSLLSCGLALAGMPLFSVGADITINGVTCTGFSSVSVTSGSDGAVSITAPGGDLVACLSAGSGQTDDPLVNDFNPIITTPSSLTILENNTAVTTLNATDLDGTTTLPMPFTIVGGADQNFFDVNGGNQLVFNNAPDFENPSSDAGSNTYVVELQVTDGDSTGTARTTNRTFNVTVTNDTVNDVDPDDAANNYDPIIDGGPTASYNVQEGTTAVATIAASDGDTGSDTGAVTFALSGPDEALFDLGANDGVLTFKSAPDFEAPGSDANSNTYSLLVTASDNDAGGAKTATQSITVNVTDDTSDNNGACGAPDPNVSPQNDIDWSNQAGSGGLIPLNNEIKSYGFTTTSGASFNGKVSVAASTGNSDVERKVWFSECPGGDAIETPAAVYCERTGTSTTTLFWDQGNNISWGCKLAPGTKYYLNIQNLAPSNNPSRCNLTKSCDVHVAYRVTGTP